MRSQVTNLGGYSAHADQRELIAWLSQMPKAPKQVYLIHGDLEASQALRKKMSVDLNLAVNIGLRNSVVDLA